MSILSENCLVKYLPTQTQCLNQFVDYTEFQDSYLMTILRYNFVFASKLFFVQSAEINVFAFILIVVNK